jgi:SAM-dependent methyltransferase
MKQVEYYRMAESESSHWWYRSLHKLVLGELNKHFDSNGIFIIDAGCGTGGLIGYLERHGYTQVEGFDDSNTAVQICKNRKMPVFKGDIRDVTEYFMEHSADAVISNDTFYYLDIKEQRKFTDDVYPILRDEGIIIVNIPVFKSFRGIHDIQVGIRERYHHSDIWNSFDRDKYRMVTKVYWPFFLSPAIWLTRFVQRIKLRYSQDISLVSDLGNENKITNEILYGITSTENELMPRKPFGSSLFLVMKKINKSNGKKEK